MAADPYKFKTVNGKQYREHQYIASLALKRKLRKGEHVHHIDYNKKNNDPSNLIVCSNDYHRIIHARTDALNACGNASFMKCAYCGEYDDPFNMYVREKIYQAWHRECRQKARKVAK